MGGAARRSDRVGGWSDRRQLERLVAAGEVIDHLGGCYALPSAPDWTLRARQFRGLVTCVSWAQVRGLAVLEPSHRVHLAVPASRGGKSSPVRPTRAVVLHRSAAVPDRDCKRPLARAEVALAHILRCLEPRSAIVTVDSALHARLSTSEEIRAELTNRGSVAARLTLDRCDPRSESLLESLARLELRAAGLRVEVAVPIEGAPDVPGAIPVVPRACRCPLRHTGTVSVRGGAAGCWWGAGGRGRVAGVTPSRARRRRSGGRPR